MPQFDWSQKVIMKLWHSLPEKYIDGSFIENRIIQDEFTMEDINKNAYYMRDILRSYISCEMKTSEKKRKLSSGECSTITMMVLCSELNSRHEVGRLLYLAYLHDLDPIFSRCLPPRLVSKLRRRRTYTMKGWEKELYGFWNPQSKKHLPLDDAALEEIENWIKSMDPETIEKVFDSDDVTAFAEHVCQVMELAFGNKTFTLTTFSEEAYERAIDILEALDEEMVEEGRDNDWKK